MDYVNGLKIYEAIVEEIILKTAQNQIKNLEKVSEQLIIEDKIPESGEAQQIKQIAEDKISEKKQEVEKQVEDIKKNEEMVNQDPTAVLKEEQKEEEAKKSDEKKSEIVVEDVPNPANVIIQRL